MHKKNEYEPAAVSPDTRQSGVSKFFFGLDVKRFPPHQDPELQARIERIGTSLIPAYQRALPPDDPTRFNFRFQIVDIKEYNEPSTLPNGIVIVPYIGLDRLRSDSELAAPIAVAIAFALEKEQVRGRSARNSITSGQVAGEIAGIFIPFAGLPGDIAGGIAKRHLLELQVEQSGRVALCLMHDAGYDLKLAPIALWLSASKKPKPIEEIKMPAHATNLYKALGTTWQPGTLATMN